MTIHVGLDVSGYDDRRYQFHKGYIYDRPTTWDEARTGIVNLGEFVIVKASEARYRDPGYPCQREAIGNTRPCAHYHLLRQNANPVEQAKFFCDVIYPHYTDALDMPLVDWETRDGADNLTILRNGGAFLNEVVRQFGNCGIYTFPAYWNGINGGPATGFKDFPLYIAEWHWDNWLSVLQLPPYSFRLTQIKSWLEGIEIAADFPYESLSKTDKQYQPTPLAPWYSWDNRDWYWGW